MREVEHLLAIKNILGESPLWHVAEQSLYWVDIKANCFFTYQPATAKLEKFEVGLPVGALAFCDNNRLLMATAKGFAFWDKQTAQLEFISNPEAQRPDPTARFNDGRLDHRGRFWAGTLGQGFESSLYRLDPDGRVYRMEKEIGVSNGIGWSPDNTIMYYTDSRQKTIYAYDFNLDKGEITNRRIFIYTPNEVGVPDGLAVDSEGCIWSVRWGGWKISRYTPEGNLITEVNLPVEFPTSCAFGGANLDELFITSAWTNPEKTRPALAGDIFRLKLEVSGLTEKQKAVA